jgi:hypothetical protein
LLFVSEVPLVAKNGYIVPDYLATFGKDLAAGRKDAHRDDESKVPQQDRPLSWRWDCPNCTAWSSIADLRVA